MRCLFCGKELALLKRLRGGGEFCSEAHRKEYQEQYEQLALARLLQAKPPAESASPDQAPLGQPSPAPLFIPDPVPESPRPQVPAYTPPQPQIDGHRAVATVESPASSQKTPADAGPAPLAGFVHEPMVPAVTTVDHAASLEFESVAVNGAAHSPALVMAAPASDSPESLPPAPRVDLDLSLQALDHHTRNSDRGMDVREFTGPAMVMELHLRPDDGTEPAAAADAMEILMSPHPPQKAAPWLAAPRGFPAAPAELGQLARLDFAPTGFAYSDGHVAASPQPPQADPPAQQPPEVMAAPIAVEMRPAAAPPPEPLPPAEPAPPELVTRALPVTLHGLSAPRAKLAQTFTSAITAATDVQIPPSTALPLRPTIVFGPAPAPPAPVQPKVESVKTAKPEPIKAEPVKAAPVKAVPVKAEPEKAASSFQTSVVPLPKGVPAKQPVAAEIKPPKASAPVATSPFPRKESPAPQAFEAAAAASDAAIPSLHLDATESSWSKMSTGLKLGVAAALIAGISGIGYLVTRGGGKAATEAPAAAPAVTSVASGVPISGGWIDDWANAAKSKRHVSMLSGSVKLSDYRLEFLAQIQTKAIGWIFRGLNPRNYYVTKLEIVTPGLDPTVALVHFAVVDGVDENRVVVPLPMKVRVDTTYKIRFEAIGNHFSTWVQGQKVDEWSDSRFGSGGVGLFSDRDEQAAMQGNVNVIALVPRN